MLLDQQDGLAILVGHSWGGAVITQAGVHPKVVGLVYVAAFQPDLGESAFTWFSSMPPVPENGVMPPDEKGFVYYSKETNATYYNDNAFENICKYPSLRKLFADTFHLRSHLEMPINIQNEKPFSFCLYSRRPMHIMPST